jgi:simple sugar transport system permease protein
VRNGRLAAGLLSFGLSVATAVVAVAVSMLVIALTGGEAGEAARALYDGAFGSRAQVAGTLGKMIPLILVALGWILAFSARRINIGFEGQILAGGILATLVGLAPIGLPAPLHLTLAVLAGVVGGMLYAGVAAFLWAARGVNEIISTLMLNFVAIQIVSWLVRGPIQEPTNTFPRSKPIPEAALWPKLIENTPLGFDLFLAVAMIPVIWVVLARTTFGFNLRLTGASELAARHAGVRTTRITVAALVLSGGLAGLAGASTILGGETASMSDNFSASYGFTGIVVALLARNSPWGVLPSALLFAALRQGGGLMEARVGVSSALVLITQAVVILVVAGAAYLVERRRSVRVDAVAERRGPPPEAEPAPSGDAVERAERA